MTANSRRGAAGANGIPATAYLFVACVVVLIEALVLLGIAIAEVAAIASDRLGLGVSTAVFFAVLGLGLACAAYALWRRVRGARSPIVFAQLIQLGMAWSMREMSPVVVPIALAVAALVVLGCVLAPATTAALTESDDD